MQHVPLAIPPPPGVGSYTPRPPPPPHSSHPRTQTFRNGSAGVLRYSSDIWLTGRWVYNTVQYIHYSIISNPGGYTYLSIYPLTKISTRQGKYLPLEGIYLPQEDKYLPLEGIYLPLEGIYLPLEGIYIYPCRAYIYPWRAYIYPWRAHEWWIYHITASGSSGLTAATISWPGMLWKSSGSCWCFY